MKAIGEAVRDARHRIVGFQGALQDISLQRINEAERHALAIKLSNTLRDMSDAFFTLDRNWHITYVNEEMTRAVRRKREELLHQLMWDAFPGTENSAFHQCYLRALETRTVATVVEYYAPLDSWYSVRVHPTDDGLAIYFQNVTKSRKDEEQLRLLQTCVERMNDIVLITQAGSSEDLPPRVVYVNKAFERHTGFRADEIVGKLPAELPGIDTQHGVLERISGHLKGSQAARTEMLNHTRDGEELWLELDIAAVEGADGRPTHWIVIERNITERKRIAESLREKNDLLRVGGRVGRIGGWTAAPAETPCAGPKRSTPCWNGQGPRPPH